MKTILALTASAFVAGALSAQCPKSCDAAEKTSLTQDCQAKKASLTSTQCSSQSTVLAKFGKLKPEAQKEVATALVSLCKTCPMGSKVPGTMATLDRLYGEALTSLQKVAKNKNTSEAIKKDLGKQIKLITQLNHLNKANLTTMKSIASKAGTECGENCAAACCDEEKSCAFTSSEKLTKAWGGAMKELSECQKCEKTMTAMKGQMETLKKHGIDVQTFTTTNFVAQQQLLDKQCGQLACSKGGIMARHSETMNACSWTNDNCSKGVKAIVSAHKLLKATPFANFAKKAAPKKVKKTSKTSNAGECPFSGKSAPKNSKNECTKVKQ